MKKNIFLFGVLLSLLIACKSSKNSSASSANETWIIADQKVPCSDGATKLCFQVKKTGESEYSVLNAEIAGFNFEPNHKYQIVVKSKKGSYELVQELFKVATKK